ncbi:hypothetical protein GCM10027406_07040 [Leifsonia lichenia]
MKLSSNTGAAQSAVSGFADIDVDVKRHQVSLGSSNVLSMKNGANVSENVLSVVTELVSGVKRQATGVTALATEIEQRDKRDAAAVGGNR